ncbi:hypothetical protein GALMADRAFT_253491 [Galerina marginata CBS 339.88]|uniref:DUF6535 domain-containing protein n=1 Tax=Galerina marginata (strain CBS 339.88) TaxID=685588 RepID=A0A067SLB6_GALM3|nr:hypothetical protein GALMADRAFT_253491 [Galerina marginata CBS 339.88]
MAPFSFTNPVFTPTHSSIRVNAFWFLSLVLSLTTVLVGIVTLQWLREYQSYPGLSPRDTRAVFRMRSEGMERWYVWRIFTILPLLLQAALILFFGGIIDFLLALESKVAIPVAIVIGSALLFLAATTALPTLQGLFLYLPFLFVRDLSEPPTQCPYKSPQAHAFRTMLSSSFTLAHHTFLTLRPLFQRISSLFRLPPGSEIEADNIEHHYVLSQLLVTWQKKTWIDFDSAWLSLRGICVQGLKDQQPGLNSHCHKLHPNFLRLFDSVRAVQEAIQDSTFNQTDMFRSAIYHCFSDMSTTFLTDSWSKHYYTFHEDTFHRQHRYFFTLWYEGAADYESQYKFNYHEPLTRRWDSDQDLNLTTFHYQNLQLFAWQTWAANSQVFLNHAAELHIRLAKCWGTAQFVHSSEREPGTQLPCHLLLPYDWKLCMNSVLLWQYSHVIMAFFKSAANIGDEIRPNCLIAHPCVIDFLEGAASTTELAMTLPGLPTTQYDIGLSDAYSAVFSYIRDQLNLSLASIATNDQDTIRPGIFIFYTSAIYVRNLMAEGAYHWDALNRDSIGLLLPLLQNYRRQTIDIGIVDEFLEHQFTGIDFGFVRFSKEWWSFLDYEVCSVDVYLYLDPNSWMSQSPENLQVSHPHASNDSVDRGVGTSDSNHVVVPIEYSSTRIPNPNRERLSSL